MSDEPLDRSVIEALATDVLLPVRAHLRAGPMHTDRVFEALNALAFAAASVIVGADDPKGRPLDFFARALAENISNGVIDRLRAKPPLQ